MHCLDEVRKQLIAKRYELAKLGHPIADGKVTSLYRYKLYKEIQELNKQLNEALQMDAYR